MCVPSIAKSFVGFPPVTVGYSVPKCARTLAVKYYWTTSRDIPISAAEYDEADPLSGD
jgi:hypothetical protein